MGPTADNVFIKMLVSSPHFGSIHSVCVRDQSAGQADTDEVSSPKCPKQQNVPLIFIRINKYVICLCTSSVEKSLKNVQITVSCPPVNRPLIGAPHVPVKGAVPSWCSSAQCRYRSVWSQIRRNNPPSVPTTQCQWAAADPESVARAERRASQGGWGCCNECNFCLGGAI